MIASASATPLPWMWEQTGGRDPSYPHLGSAPSSTVCPSSVIQRGCFVPAVSDVSRRSTFRSIVAAKRFAAPRFTGGNILLAFKAKCERRVASEGREFLEHLERVADPADLPALVMACAGRRLYVPLSPETMKPGGWIEVAIGWDKASKLVEALNEEERYGVELDIPFNGTGLLASVHRLIAERVTAGLKTGKSTTRISAECGISRRAVQMHRARLSQQGELPSDASAGNAERYRRPEPARSVARTLRLDAVELPGTGAISEDDFTDAARAAADRSANTALGREVRAVAIIERLHGRDARERIVAASRGRRCHLAPRAVIQPEHPFRAVLDEVESRLLALRIVAETNSTAPLSFHHDLRLKARGKMRQVEAHLRSGIRPSIIAEKLGVSRAYVLSVALRLELPTFDTFRTIDQI